MSVANVRWKLDQAENAGISAGTDFGDEGIKADVIAESTTNAGVTIDGVILKDYTAKTSGTIALTSVTGVLGYTASSTVTQATSKATGVTIHAAAGQITMSNASLAAGAEVTFIVTNSRVGPKDVVALSLQTTGATAGAYTATVNEVGTGVFSITVSNTTAGALGEALVINFMVLAVTG